MKSKVVSAIIVLFACAQIGFALDVTINVSGPDQSASTLGIQTALNNIGNAGGGTLTLKDTSPSKNASISVYDVLYVSANTNVYGDASRTPYGMTVYGAARPGSYRDRAYPIFFANGSNIEFYNLYFSHPTIRQYGSAIGNAAGTNDVDVTYCYIQNFTVNAIGLSGGSGHNMSYVTIDMYWPGASYPYDYSGGCSGIWLNGVSNSTVDHCIVSGGSSWYNTIPYGDPRYASSSSKAPTCDLVASYSGSTNYFQHNTITNGNTAGIYLAKNPSSGSYNVIWDNTVCNMRQLGLDTDGEYALQVLTNSVYTTDSPNLGLAAANSATVQYNTFYDGGRYDHSTGAVYLLWSSTGCDINGNNIYGAMNNYSVYFSSVSGNSLHGNSEWAGLSGYEGGSTGSNSIYSNNHY
jgi:hypothetical protein